MVIFHSFVNVYQRVSIFGFDHGFDSAFFIAGNLLDVLVRW